MGIAKRLTRELFGESEQTKADARELLAYTRSPEIYGVTATLAPRFSNPYRPLMPEEVGFD